MFGIIDMLATWNFCFFSLSVSYEEIPHNKT